MAEYRVFKVDVDFKFQTAYRIPVEKKICEDQSKDVKRDALPFITVDMLIRLYQHFDEYVKIKCVTDREDNDGSSQSNR